MLLFPANLKTLLEFMLNILPASGSSYLPVFRFVHGFCEGESFLSPSDEALLLAQLRQPPTAGEGGGGGSDGDGGSSEKSEGEKAKKSNEKESNSEFCFLIR